MVGVRASSTGYQGYINLWSTEGKNQRLVIEQTALIIEAIRVYVAAHGI